MLNPITLRLVAVRLLTGGLAWVALVCLVGCGQSLPTPTPAPSPTLPPAKIITLPPATVRPALIGTIDGIRFTYEPGWGTLEVQRFLDRQAGPLKTTTLPVGSNRVSLASVLTDQALLYSLNPKVLLTLLEMQAGLVRNPQPTPADWNWAMGNRQSAAAGLGPQLYWVTRELYRAARDDISAMTTTGYGTYALTRLLNQTVDQTGRPWSPDVAKTTFIQTYQDLFDEDPREPLTTLPPPSIPFLRKPYSGSKVMPSAAFDHEFPLLQKNGSMLSFRGRRDQSAYDSHNGWDYPLAAGTPVLAAAAGRVLVAGFSDDGCATPAGAVILDHENGYRTLYWHLQTVTVSAGQRVAAGERIGTSGNTGCSEGPHLHLGVQYLGRATDPNGWCKESLLGSDPWANHPAGGSSRWLWLDESSPCLAGEGAILVDDSEPAFRRTGSGWQTAGGGFLGQTSWVMTGGKAGVVQGNWQPTLPRAGRYQVYAYIPRVYTGVNDSAAAVYQVTHASGTTSVTINQTANVERWVSLGTFNFSAGKGEGVTLDAATGESRRSLLYDALLWVPVGP